MTNHDNEESNINLHASENSLPLDHIINSHVSPIHIAQFQMDMGKLVPIQSHVAQQSSFNTIPSSSISVIKEEPISQVVPLHLHNHSFIQQHQQQVLPLQATVAQTPQQQPLPVQNHPIIIEMPKKTPPKRRYTGNAAQRKRKEQLKAEAEADLTQINSLGSPVAAPVKRKRMSVACLGCRGRKIKVSSISWFIVGRFIFFCSSIFANFSV